MTAVRSARSNEVGRAACGARLRSLSGVHRPYWADRQGQLMVEFTRSPNRPATPGPCAKRPPLARSGRRVAGYHVVKRPETGAAEVRQLRAVHTVLPALGSRLCYALGRAPSGPDPTATGGSSSPSCFWLPLVLCLGPVSLELARRLRSRASTKRFVHAPPALADALRARAGP